jgi:hypothetical protein
MRVPAEIKNALRTAAVEDDRAMSNMVTQILRAWLVQEGYMAKVAGPGKKTKRR